MSIHKTFDLPVEPWRIELFGGLKAQQGDRVITRFRTHNAGVLLAYLACFPKRAHPREALIELLWPDSEPSAGSPRLRQELAYLRRQLEPPGTQSGAVIIAAREYIRLNPAAISTDVAEFED